MSDDKKQNSNNLYTYLMFEKFWNEHKEFLKQQIMYGPMSIQNSDGESIKDKRKEYYQWLRENYISTFFFLNNKGKDPLYWHNGNYANIDDKDFEEKVRQAVWITFNLLIDKCETGQGNKDENEWGKVAEVFKVVLHILLGNKCKLPYSAMGYMFIVLSSDVSLQAIYKGLNLLYRKYDNQNYNISDYSYRLKGIKQNKDDENTYTYTVEAKTINGKSQPNYNRKEDLTAGTLDKDLENNRLSSILLCDIVDCVNVHNLANIMVRHRNCTIHKGLTITDHFQKDSDAYKNRLAGIVYDYVTTVFYLREYIDTVWNDQNTNPGKYSSGQNERTFKNFVSPAVEIIEDIVNQMGQCDECAKSVTEREKEDYEADLQDVSKHYAFIVDIGTVIGKEAPEEISKLFPTILSDPGSVNDLMKKIGEPLLNRMKAVNAENNGKLKEELTIAFKNFLDENHAKLEQQYVKLNAEVELMEQSMAQVQSDISDLKEGQKGILGKLYETKEEIEYRLKEKFDKIFNSAIASLTAKVEQLSQDVAEVKITQREQGKVQEQQGKDIYTLVERGKKEDEEKERQNKIKQKHKWIKITVASVVAFILTVGALIWVNKDSILKNHYANKADKELILAREFEQERKYKEAAVHNKAAFRNTLNAFNLDSTDNNLRRRLVYMYQWGKGTLENKVEAFRLAESLKDVSSKDFGRYIYLKYLTVPSNNDSEVLIELENQRQKDSHEILQDSLVKLTDALCKLRYTNNKEIEDNAYSLLEDYANSGLHEAEWELANLMLQNQKELYSKNKLRFHPSKTHKLLNNVASSINYSLAWKSLGELSKKWSQREEIIKYLNRAILAGDSNVGVYDDLLRYNGSLWSETGDSAYYSAYHNSLDSAKTKGSKFAKFIIAANSNSIMNDNYASLINSDLAPYALFLTRRLLTDSASMAIALELLRKKGRNDVNMSYLKAHKAYYDHDYLNYVNYMQQAGEDSCVMAYICLGSHYYNEGNLEEAQNYFKQVVDSDKSIDQSIREMAYRGLAYIAQDFGNDIDFSKYVKSADAITKVLAPNRVDYENIVKEVEELFFSTRFDSFADEEKIMLAYRIAQAYHKVQKLPLALDWIMIPAYGAEYNDNDDIRDMFNWEAFQIAYSLDIKAAEERLYEYEFTPEDLKNPAYIHESARKIRDSALTIHTDTPKCMAFSDGKRFMVASDTFLKFCKNALNWANDSEQEFLMKYAIIIDAIYGTKIVDELCSMGFTDSIEHEPYIIGLRFEDSAIVNVSLVEF